MSEIYQLSQFQFNTLMNAANNAQRTVVFVGSCPKDTTAQKKILDEQWQDMQDMIHEGLLVDVSNRFETMLHTVKLNSDRDSTVCALTSLAMYMFCDAEERKPC